MALLFLTKTETFHWWNEMRWEINAQKIQTPQGSEIENNEGFLSSAAFCVKKMLHPLSLIQHLLSGQDLWDHSLGAIGWHITTSKNTRDLLSTILTGHLSKKEKQSLLHNIVWALWWSIWIERNYHIFIDNKQDYKALHTSYVSFFLV